MRTVLLVEDDPEITGLLSLHLNTSGFVLTCCSTGQEALNRICSQIFNLIILDVTLPDNNGMHICKHIRANGDNTPIMMLTCHDGEADKVLALNLGADDYVTKPFGVLELMARVKAILRRAEHKDHRTEATKDEIIFKDLVIDATKRKATLDNKRMELTSKEFDLLLLLASNAGKTFSRKELLQQVWGIAFTGYEHTITSHINRLRIKLETDLQFPKYILTAWGTGYRFAE